MRILNEIICPFEGWARLAEGGQILPLEVVQALLVTDKQPDGGGGRKRMEPVGVESSLNAGLLEGFNMAIDRQF